MMLHLRLFVLGMILLFFFTGCGTRTVEDFKEEGEGITRSLIQEFQKIHSRDQLLASSRKLQRLFEELADVMIQAQEFRLKHLGGEFIELVKIDHELSDELRAELNRIYHFEGGRQIIEKCQEIALNRLDAFERKKGLIRLD